MERGFESLFRESEIFANREVLSPHYIPEHLLFRDRQIQEIENAITPSLRGERGRNVFIYGKTGTGKTSCMKYVVEQIKRLPMVKAEISYINCRVYNSRYRVLSKIASDHIPLYAKRGYGVIDIYEKMISWVEEEGRMLIVILDEIDIIKDLDDLVYTLTRANSDMKSGGITIIGISNKASFKEDLDPRSLSTLYENELAFPPYDSQELSAIVSDRIRSGFKPDVVDPSCTNLVAAIAAKESGDARLALKILSRAGEISEERNLKRVGPEEVRAAAKQAEEEIAYELINMLPEHEKLIVYAIAVMTVNGSRYKRLSDGDDSFVLSGEIYNRYASIAESLGKGVKSSRLYRRYIADLNMQGIILSYDSGKGVRGHTKLIRLAYNSAKVKNIIEKSLFSEREAEAKAEGTPEKPETE